MRICERCGKRYDSQDRRRRYCGEECAAAANRDNVAAANRRHYDKRMGR